MKMVLRAIALFVLGAGLAACVTNQPVYHTTYKLNAPKTQSGKQCVKRCMRHKKTCDRACGANHEQCLFNERLKAKQRYIKYVDQMLLAGKKIERNEASFINREACDASCACVSGYKDCYTVCGGGVSKRKVCFENCAQ